MAIVYNPGSGPVSVDDGRVVGGGERADVTLTKLVSEHLDANRLIKVADSPAPAQQAPATQADASTSKESK